MKKKGKNYYLHFISALVLWAFVLGYWTIKNAVENPVQLDDTFMMKYQKVDSDINKIIAKGIAFDKKYTMQLLTKKIHEGKNKLQIKLADKNNKAIKDASLTVLVTRPVSKKYDKKQTIKVKNSIVSIDVNIDKPGRWNVILRAKVDNLERFQLYKLSTLLN